LGVVVVREPRKRSESFYPSPLRALPRLLNRGLGELAVGRLKLLQRDDVGLFGAQPAAVWRGQKTWNGVAIRARGCEPIVTRRELPGDPDDGQARYFAMMPTNAAM
jgi:hypothetical protein